MPLLTPQRGVAGLALLALVCLGSGCAACYRHADGSETHVGLVWLRVFPAGNPVAIRSRTLGVALDAGAQGNGFLVGYRGLLRLTPPDDKVVVLDYEDRGFWVGPAKLSLQMSDGLGPSPGSLDAR
jgi:hypothetical protein